MKDKLKIYSDRKYLPPNTGWSEILFPFWGKLPELNEMLGYERFESYTNEGRLYFDLVDDIKSCDIAILPNDWKRYVRTDSVNLAKDFTKLADSFGKKVLCSYFSDDEKEIPLTNTITLRPSLNKSTKKDTELPMPAWIMDYYPYKNIDLIERKWNIRPIVSFCGYAKPSIRKILSNELHRFQGRTYSPGYYGLKLRQKALKYISQSKKIDSNLRLRTQYFGGIFNQNKTKNDSYIQNVREQYFENIINSDYVLCIRGAGNFSFRFYETLACGRIPVFVNTDCCLPFDDLIDFKQHCVWIEESEISSIENHIFQFHQSLSQTDFLDLQYRNRELWISYLSPNGYYKHLSSILRKLI